MKMKTLVVFSILVFVVTSLYSQGKFGKPSIDELQLIESEIDNEAEAEFISKTCEISFSYNENSGFTKHRRVSAKLKIYDKDDAKEWASIVIPLYDEEDISSIKAYIHNLEDGKIVTEKLAKDEIYTEEVIDLWERKRFTFPNVKDGSVLEWQYTISSPYLRYIDIWYFQHSIPVKYTSFEVTIPEYYNYQALLTGFEFPYDISEGSGSDRLTLGLDSYFYSNENKTIIYKDVPALKRENFVFNINNYRNSIRYELVYTKLPHQTVTLFSATWKSIAKELLEYDRFGLQVSKSHYYKDQFEGISAELRGKDVKEQTRHIFNYVRNRMKWNNDKALYTDQGVKKAFETKTGNSAEINLILVSMLRSAGLEANPLVLSTVDNGILGFSYPSKSRLNYVIAAVEDGDKLYLMDASSEYSNINVLPSYCLNYKGIIIYADNSYKEVSIENSTLIKNVSLIYEIDDNYEIVGNYSKKEGGVETISKRESLNKSEEGEIEKLHKSNSDVLKEEISFENIEDINLTLNTNYKFRDNTSVQEIGGKLFISPLLFERQKENPFKKENRQFAVELGNQIKETCMVVFNIPEGFTVEYLPQPIKYKMVGGMGDYTFMVQQLNNKIHITKILRLNKPIYSAEEAKMLREIFMKIVEKEEEKVVLVKSE